MKSATRPLPSLTLEKRLVEDLRMTGGTMPLAVIVEDAAEAERARRFLAGKKNVRLLTIVTAEESRAKWARTCGASIMGSVRAGRC